VVRATIYLALISAAVHEDQQCLSPHLEYSSLLLCSVLLRAGAVLRGGWVSHTPRFLAGPLLDHPSFVLNFTFKFVWFTYTADNFQPAKL